MKHWFFLFDPKSFGNLQNVGIIGMAVCKNCFIFTENDWYIAISVIYYPTHFIYAVPTFCTKVYSIYVIAVYNFKMCDGFACTYELRELSMTKIFKFISNVVNFYEMSKIFKIRNITIRKNLKIPLQTFPPRIHLLSWDIGYWILIDFVRQLLYSNGIGE